LFTQIELQGVSMNRTIALLMVGLAFFHSAASARDFTVPDQNPEALIEAFALAARHPGPDRIILAYRGTYVLTRAAAPLLALPPITDAVKILGRGAEIRVYTSAPLGVLRVSPGAELRAFDLLIAGSTHTALVNQGRTWLTQVRFEDNVSRNLAAAIDNQADLDLRDCTVSFNSTLGRALVAGIFNSGALTADGLTMGSNFHQGDRFSRRAAAAVFNQGEMTLANARLEGNEVLGIDGGALVNTARGSLKLDRTTIEALETPAVAAEFGDQPINLDATLLMSAAR
jgi:hypothetical protein